MQNMLGKAQSFIFGAGTDNPTYESLRKRREIADLLARQATSGTPQNVGEGIGAIGKALAGKWIERRIAPKEDAARADAKAQLAAILGGGGGGMGQTFAPGGAAPAAAPMGGAAAMPSGGGAPTAQAPAELAPLFAQTEQQYGLPSGYLTRTADIESNFNANAANPASSAEGPFQFIDSTAQQYGLTNKRDWGAATDAAARLAADNAAQLRQVLGREPTGAELYLAHQQGGGGAAKLLANPDAPAAALVGEDAVRLNGGDATMSARDFAGLWLSKFGGGAGGGASVPMGGGMGAPGPNMGMIEQISELLANPYASESDKLIGQALLAQQVNQMAPPEQMTPYQQAQIALERERLKVGNRGTYGLTPIQGTDADGNPIYLQPGSDGTVNVMKFPEGFQPTPGVERVDVGTGTALINTRTGEQIGFIPKDNRTPEREKGIGAAQGESIGNAVTGLGSATAQAEQASALIESIVTSPDLEGITGFFEGRIPPLSQGGEDLNVKISQLEGKAFLEAFESLKGGGAITNAEGEKAQAAMARLKRTQSTGEFQASLRELQGIINLGVERMRAKAAQAQTAGQGVNPMGGGPLVIDGYQIEPVE